MGFINTASNLATSLNTRQSARNGKKHLAQAQIQTQALAQQNQILQAQLEAHRVSAAQTSAIQAADHAFRYDTDETYRNWHDQRVAEAARQSAAMAELQRQQALVAVQMAEAQRLARVERNLANARLAWSVLRGVGAFLISLRTWAWVGWVAVPYLMILIPPHAPPLRAKWWLNLKQRWRVLIGLAWIALYLVLIFSSSANASR